MPTDILSVTTKGRPLWNPPTSDVKINSRVPINSITAKSRPVICDSGPQSHQQKPIHMNLLTVSDFQ